MDAVNRIRQQVVTLLEKRCREPNPPAWMLAWLAAIYARDDRASEAIDYYRQALALDYSQVEWRYARARLLVDSGAVTEGTQEAKTCLQFPSGIRAGQAIALHACNGSTSCQITVALTGGMQRVSPVEVSA